MSGEHTHAAFDTLNLTVTEITARLEKIEQLIKETPPPVVLPSDVFVRTYHQMSESDNIEGQHAHPHGIQMVAAPKYSNQWAAQFWLKNTDTREPATNGFRAEFHGGDNIANSLLTTGFVRSYGVAMYFPPDWNQGKNSGWDDRIIFQFHEGKGSPAFSLHVDAAKQELWFRRKAQDLRLVSAGLRMRFEPGRYYNIAFQCCWSRDMNGYLRAWIDGKQFVDYIGPTITKQGGTLYTKWGIYGQPTKLLVAEVRRADGNRLNHVVTVW